MRKMLLALAVAGVSIFAEAAFAADMVNPIYAPPPRPAFSWTGFYVGVNVGGDAQKHTTTDAGVTTMSGTIAGVVGGGQLGANWQIGSFVLGVEVDAQGSSESKSATTPVMIFNLTETFSQPWFATFRGRVGWAFADGWLVYTTLGGSWLNAKETFTASTGGASVTSAFDLSHVGWAGGFGVEGALTRNWSWKVEYLHVETDKFTTNVNIFGVSVPWKTNLGDDIVRVGANYRF
jgi:outer membrane immunogenic protein